MRKEPPTIEEWGAARFTVQDLYDWLLTDCPREQLFYDHHAHVTDVLSAYLRAKYPSADNIVVGFTFAIIRFPPVFNQPRRTYRLTPELVSYCSFMDGETCSSKAGLLEVQFLTREFLKRKHIEKTATS